MTDTMLKDVQKQTDKRGIDIQKVGVNGVDVPLTIERKNSDSQIVSAKARLSVTLPIQTGEHTCPDLLKY